MNVTINGCALNVEVMGPEDGPVLIAHHGGGGIGSLAEPKATFGPLADRFRVVVFDARGCGHSEGVPPYSHAQWAADVDGLRAVDRRGQDRRRGRLLRRVHRPRVRRRATPSTSRRSCSATPPPTRPTWSSPTRTPATRTASRSTGTTSTATGPGGSRDDEDLKARWAEIIPLYDYEYDPVALGRARSRRASTGTRRTTGASSTTTPSYDLKPQLPAVTAPTLVTVGRRDWVTPVSSAQTIASLMPNAKLVIFEKSGHSPQIEERELFLSTVRDFLDRAVPRSRITVKHHHHRRRRDRRHPRRAHDPGRPRHHPVRRRRRPRRRHPRARADHRGPGQRVHRRRATRSPPTSSPTRSTAPSSRSRACTPAPRPSCSRDRLAPDGYVLTVQNGLTADT